MPDQFQEVNWESSPTTLEGSHHDCADDHQMMGTVK